MSQEKNELLDRYFFGELSADEMKAFREGLRTDAELKTEFELRQLTKSAFFKKDMHKMKREAKVNSDNSKPAKIVSMRQRVVRWSAAAIFILILGFLGNYIFQNFNAPNPYFVKYDLEELYPKTKYALVNEGTKHKGIVNSDNFDEFKKAGLSAFDAKKWQQSIDLLNEYLSKAEPSEEDTPDEINIVRLFLGRAYLEISEHKKAIKVLEQGTEKVVDLDNYQLVKELFQWQLVLAYLKNNEVEAAKKIAKQLENALHGTIQSQSNNLLNDLN